MELRYNQNSSNILHITKGIKPEAEKHDIRWTKAILTYFNHVYLPSSKALLRVQVPLPCYSHEYKLMLVEQVSLCIVFKAYS